MHLPVLYRSIIDLLQEVVHDLTQQVVLHSDEGLATWEVAVSLELRSKLSFSFTWLTYFTLHRHGEDRTLGEVILTDGHRRQVVARDRAVKLEVTRLRYEGEARTALVVVLDLLGEAGGEDGVDDRRLIDDLTDGDGLELGIVKRTTIGAVADLAACDDEDERPDEGEDTAVELILPVHIP